jgi:hypothetical protein
MAHRTPRHHGRFSPSNRVLLALAGLAAIGGGVGVGATEGFGAGPAQGLVAMGPEVAWLIGGLQIALGAALLLLAWRGRG